jgi:uncharacterized protein (DUF2236 family)
MPFAIRPRPDVARAVSPQSVAWRINAERLVLLGWGRAILLQLAHPLVAAGGADHSSFQRSRYASLRRLHDTVQAALALTFGTPEQAARSAAGINRIHDRVHGRLPAAVGRFQTGTPYSAHDPALLAWVELTLLDSLPLAYELFVGPLSPAEKDAWVREARGSVQMLGLPPDLLPDSFDGLQQTMNERLASGDIVVGETARRLARTVLYPPLGSIAWPWSRLNRLSTIGRLPPSVREGYGLAWTPADERALQRSARVCRAIARHTPRLLRHWRGARR